MRYHFQDHAPETRNLAGSLKPLALVARTEAAGQNAEADQSSADGQENAADQVNADDAAAGGDAATALQDASDALAAATTAVDQALADLGAAGNADGAAAQDGAAKDDTAQDDATEEIFVVPFSEEIQNLGITLDFDANTMQVVHSIGATALAQVTEAVVNGNSGLGEYHFALLKNGDQQEDIDEGIIMSGISMEDSTDGMVTLE